MACGDPYRVSLVPETSLRDCTPQAGVRPVTHPFCDRCGSC